MVEDWDRWFPLVGLAKEWAAVKSVESDPEKQCNWAQILELNRLNALEKQIECYSSKSETRI